MKKILELKSWTRFLTKNGSNNEQNEINYESVKNQIAKEIVDNDKLLYNEETKQITVSPDIGGITSGQEVIDALGYTPADEDSLMQYANSHFFEEQNGIYHPILTGESFDNPSANATNGLTTHANGGVVATVAGTEGIGNIYLPQSIDPSKPFKFACLVELNDSQPIKVIFSRYDGDWRSGFVFTLTNADIVATVGGGVIFNSYGHNTIPNGTKVWICMASDGATGVFVSVIPDSYPNGFSFGVPSYQQAWDNQAYCVQSAMDLQYSGSGINAFGGDGLQFKNRLCRFQVSSKSTTNRIIGVFVNQGFSNPKDGRLKPPTVFKTTVLQDSSAIVIIPKQQGTRPIDMVMLNHPNAYNVAGFIGNATANAGITMGKLHNEGYLLFGLDGLYGGTSYVFTEATCSNWGAPTGMKYRKALWKYIRDNVQGTRYIHEMGLSMGFLNSLRLSIQYPNQIKSIVGVSGVCDLTDCYNNRGFSAIINKAFSTWFTSLQPATGINPQTIVNVNANALVSATSISCTALAYSVPSGTTITLKSGTGQTTVVTTALANANATSIAVTALTDAITSGAKYDASTYWNQITYGFAQPLESYYSAPYIWCDTYNNATAYANNSIVAITATGTSSKTYQFVDPSLSPYSFTNIPIAIWQGDADTLIPATQAESFTSAVNAKGGNTTLHLVAGGTHLGNSCFDADGIVAFFNSIE